MSKELTPLEWLRYYKKKLQTSGQTIRPNGFDIIEKELEENDELRTHNYELLKETEYYYNERNEYKRVLKIIREKRVDIRDLQECSSLEEYNDNISMNWNSTKEADYHNELLTQKEFDLLKKYFNYEETISNYVLRKHGKDEFMIKEAKMNKEFLTPKAYAYHYDLEKIKDYVTKNWGIWEMDEPPTGLVVYLNGTEVHIGNDYPYINFKGDIEIAREIHRVGIVFLEKENKND